MAAPDAAADRVRALLRESGALRSGHFELSSGRHARHYVQCALLLELPDGGLRHVTAGEVYFGER